MDTSELQAAQNYLGTRDLGDLLREAISYDDVGDGTPVVKRNPDGSQTKGTIELYLNGVYGIDTGTDGVTELATADQLDLVREATRLREGTYGAPGQPQVYYEDAGSYRDITDLYQLLDSETPDGTKKLENAQVENLAARVLSGYPLTDIDIGVLQRLLAKYQTQLQALREDPDYDDYTSVPDPGTARLPGGS
jgi:hypothetical protein